MCALERHLLRHERQHCAIHGDRFRICLTGLSAADTSASSVQRSTFALLGATRSHGLHLQVSQTLLSFRMVPKADS